MDDYKGRGGKSRQYQGDKKYDSRPQRRNTSDRRAAQQREADDSRLPEDMKESGDPAEFGEKREKHSDLITGRNAVTEALKSGRPIESLLVARSVDSSGRSFGQIIALAREMNITVKEVSPAKLEAM